MNGSGQKGMGAMKRQDLGPRARGFVRGAAVALCALTSAGAWAQAPTPAPTGTSTGSVDPFYGSFSASVPIQVPPYHGIEPQLAISYNSSFKNGYAGVGSTLTGFSTIERASPGKGSPHYNSSDIYLLDGQELVPCVAGSTSPSCTTGGTHSTKMENYQRIAFNSTANTWTVTRKDGTKATYASTFTASQASTSCTTPPATTTCTTPTITVSGSEGGWLNTIGAGWNSTLGQYAILFGVYNGSTLTATGHITFQGGTVGTIPGSLFMHFDTIQGMGSYIQFAGADINSIRQVYNLPVGGMTVSGGITLSQTNFSSAISTITTSGNTATLTANTGETGTLTFVSTASPTCTTTTYPATCSTSGVTTLGSFRWGLSTVADMRGNTVNYGWWCDGTSPTNDCYPDNVSYNGATVQLYREIRPDPVTFANGGEPVGQTNYRLKTVDLKVSGSRARAYKLTYSTSGSTSRSLLASVQQYGKDATLDASYTVTGGSALPASSIGWTSEASGNFTVGPAWPATGTFCATGLVEYGDFNGDGKTDMECDWQTTTGGLAGTHTVALSNGDGTFTSQATWPSSGTFCALSKSWPPPIFLADFNGDGKTDLWCVSNGQVLMALSNGDGTFVSEPAWPSSGSWCTGTLFSGDFNGDGKGDLDCYTYTSSTGTGQHIVALSNGDGTFASGAAWPAGGTWGVNPYYMHLGDFDSDGKSDLIYEDTSGVHHVALSDGDGTFTVRPSWGVWCSGATPSINNANVTMGDFNGDGKTDMDCFNPSSGVHNVALSNGDGAFTAQAAYSTWAYSSPLYGDFNGDGKTDILISFVAGTSWQYGITFSRGDGTFSLAPNSPTSRGWCSTAVISSVGDFNGDGKTDLLCASVNASTNMLTSPFWVATSIGGSGSNLLTSVSNGLGATTAVSYQPSSAWTNTNNPPIQQVVSSLTVADGRGGTSTTNYSYSGGLVDYLQRRFLGFYYSKAVLPCNSGETACPYTETWFRQDYGSISKPLRINHSSGAGVLLASTTNEYSINGSTVPYTSLPTGVWQYVYDGSGTACTSWPCANAKRTYAKLTYDAYANVTQAINYGDYDFIGDEKTTTTTYYPNTSAYLVQFPADVRTFLGVGTTGSQLNESVTYYDGATVLSTPPTVGNATKGGNWLNTTNGFALSSTQYDVYGNATLVTDPLGNKTSSAFDATYHQFPIGKTNALNQTTSGTWDPACGAATNVTDANGQSVTIQYDALCRTSLVSKPLGGFESYLYMNYGNASGQYIEVDTPSADGNGNQWSQSYFDGRGRTWRTVKKGPSTSQNIFVDTSYNARSKVASQTLPYYTGAATSAVTTSYDALDRPVNVTYPDNTFVSTSYGAWSVTRNDELGHPRSATYDAYGHALTDQYSVNNSTYQTSYTYDLMGNLTTIRDAAGNNWTYIYDSLGGRVQESDPDRGKWSYAFDALGRPISRTDAKGQVTTYAYDALNRPISQTALAGTTSASTVTWRYDEARAGYFNVGHGTTMIDPAGTATYNYDAAGRVAQQSRGVDASTYAFQYGYDAGNRPLWITYPDGDTLGTATAPLKYDGSGSLYAVPGVVNSAQYTAWGALLNLANANGTSTAYAYDSRMRLGSVVTGAVQGTTTATVQKLAYTRDAEGKINTVTSPFCLEGWSYSYDQLHRLVSALNENDYTQNTALTYDPLGNITYNSQLGAYTYPAASQNQPHAVQQAGANGYTYDANGNMLTGAGRTYVWDGENRAVSVSGIAFTYDGNGERLKKVDAAGYVSHYPVPDYRVKSGVASKYIRVGGYVVAKRVGTTTYWLHTDQLGSVQLVTDSTGTTQLRMKHAPYGARIANSTTFDEEYGYIGERYDAETGLMFLHARYYDPFAARFVAADSSLPTAPGVGLNRYTYADGNPGNRLDRTGHASDLPPWEERGVVLQSLVTMQAVGKLSASLLTLVPTSMLPGAASLPSFLNFLYAAADNNQFGMFKSGLSVGGINLNSFGPIGRSVNLLDKSDSAAHNFEQAGTELGNLGGMVGDNLGNAADSAKAEFGQVADRLGKGLTNIGSDGCAGSFCQDGPEMQTLSETPGLFQIEATATPHDVVTAFTDSLFGRDSLLGQGLNIGTMLPAYMVGNSLPGQLFTLGLQMSPQGNGVASGETAPASSDTQSFPGGEPTSFGTPLSEPQIDYSDNGLGLGP